ncbi:MAG: AAA family ATPase, partial [Peptostreptococcaceae bacterium]|nr:AAA family ATPase [Peptostreptococcaceae bacterium]
MLLELVDIENFRGIKKLSLNMNRKVTILCGINGAGKTTVLDAVSHHLSWFILKVRRSSQGGSGDQLVPADIKNGASVSKILTSYSEGDEKYSVSLIKTKPGYKVSEKSDMTAFSTLADSYKQKITTTYENCSVPILVYYRVGRTAEDKVKRIRKKHNFDLLSSYENALDPQVNFRTFFEWFRTLEDIENEQFRGMILEGNKIVDSEQNPQLKIVRTVIERFTGFKKITIKRNPLRMQLEKEGTLLSVDQLSEGERDLFALVGDLARRIAIANPIMDNPLEGKGIVLIDEIELHLHPKWQKEVMSKLSATFPNVQFIISTHSPQVLSEAERDSVILLYRENGEILHSDI